MNQTIKYALVLLIGGALGYAILPTKTITRVETKEVIKEVEKKSSETAKNKQNDKVVIVVETILPDGTRRKETKIVDKGTITIDTSSNSETQKESEKESKSEKVVDRTSETLIYGIAGVNTSNLGDGPDYGLGLQKRLLGPFTGGFFGMKSGRAGVTLGLSL